MLVFWFCSFCLFVLGALPLLSLRPIARINFGEVQDSQNVDLLDPKMDLLNLAPFILLQKPHFWPILWQKVDLLVDLGWCVIPCTPPPHGPAITCYNALHVGHLFLLFLLVSGAQWFMSLVVHFCWIVYWSFCVSHIKSLHLAFVFLFEVR